MSNESLIGLYLREILPFEQCRTKMYHEEDIYYRVPTLMFRISKNADSKLYDDLRTCIESFEGILKWTEFKCFDGIKIKNHLLCPVKYYEFDKYRFGMEKLILTKEYFSDEEYKSLCEDAIADIPKLYEHIRDNFKPDIDMKAFEDTIIHRKHSLY